MAYLTDQMSYAKINSGRKTVTTAGTRVQLTTSPTPCKHIEVKALPTNTRIVVVGGSDVVAAAGSEVGIPLYPGDSYKFMINDISKIYIDSIVNGEGVTYIYYD